jgi:hypothetical protein
MPGFDGTGPRGKGPMIGRGEGYCASYSAPGYANPVPRMGGVATICVTTCPEPPTTRELCRPLTQRVGFDYIRSTGRKQRSSPHPTWNTLLLSGRMRGLCTSMLDGAIKMPSLVAIGEERSGCRRREAQPSALATLASITHGFVERRVSLRAVELSPTLQDFDERTSLSLRGNL